MLTLKQFGVTIFWVSTVPVGLSIGHYQQTRGDLPLTSDAIHCALRGGRWNYAGNCCWEAPTPKRIEQLAEQGTPIAGK